MLKNKKICIFKGKKVDNSTSEKSQFLLFAKSYVLTMSILFFSIAYNQFINFVLCGVLLLTIFGIFNIKRNKTWIQYLLLLIIAVIFGIFSFEAIGILSPESTTFQTSTDSARYLISALIQSEAAIIAIVITLSLVAIQQTSSSYSARVIDIFKDPKKTPDFFILIISYILCIVFGALLLKIIKDQSQVDKIVFPSIDIWIWVSFILFIFLLFSLILYILHTLEMFKPSTLIRLLSENINEQAIESAIELEKSNNQNKSGQIILINDTIQPIVDVLQGSIKSYDYETTRYGLKIIENKTIQIIDTKYDLTYKEAISNRIIDYVKIMGVIAAKQEMERTVNDTAYTLLRISNSLIENKIYTPISSLVSALLKIGEQTINEKLENSTINVLEILNEIGIKSVDIGIKEITQNILRSIIRITLEKIAIESNPAVYQSLYSVVCLNAIHSLRDIGKKIAAKGELEFEKGEWEFEVSMLIVGFRHVGEMLMDNTETQRNWNHLVNALLHSLYLISHELMINNSLSLIFDITSEIHSIGVKSFNKNKNVTKFSLSLLNRLEKENIKFNLQDTSELNDFKLSIHIRRLRDNISTLYGGI